MTHPATELWWAQHDKCKRCKHVIVQRETVMRCSVTPNPLAIRNGKNTYCIDARQVGQPCGPDARLYQKRK